MTANQPNESVGSETSQDDEQLVQEQSPTSQEQFQPTQESDLSDSEIEGSDPFEDLATEFSERIRQGERPSIEKYAQAHPEIADEIRELFPTIAAMEQTKARQLPPKRVQESLPMERLGDFRLLGEIGRGGMGIVYEAEQVSLGRRVAVKVLPKQALLDERHLRRFEREAQTAAKLHHTNIVPVFGVGQQDGYNYIVMQFIPGVGLDEVLLALRQQVFESDAPLKFQRSSSRGAHATHNARALLTGSFGEQVEGPISSFQRDSPPISDNTRTAVRHPTTAGHSQTVDLSGSGLNSESSLQTSESPSSSTSVDSADEAKHLNLLGDNFYQGVARIGQQVADALAYAHEQDTLHRDIKPGNLLLDKTGTVWVADFGLAKLIEQDNVSRTGDVVGTLSYIPPESFSGEADSRGDLYSLGLSLFELLTLRPAFHGRDRGKLVRDITEGNLPRLSKLNPGVPRDLETVVLKAIAQRPEDRYATARELADDLDCFLNDMPIKARRASVVEQFARWCRKNKLVASLSAAVLSLLMVLTVVFGAAALTISKERDNAKTERDNAQEFAREAEKERDKAQEFAREAIHSIIDIFAEFDPFRLPISASVSAWTNEDSAFMATQLQVGTAPSAEAMGASGDQNITNPVMAVVAPPPVNAETAAMLERLLLKMDKLIQRADQVEDLAPLSAEFTLRVAKNNKSLGKLDRASKYFDAAIERYEKLLAKTDSVHMATGLAVCLNEKGDMLAQSKETAGDAESLFKQAQEILKNRDDLDSRAKYEQAKTLFLKSVRRGRSRWLQNWTAMTYLGEAIRILKPMVATEANPEYRYLLARCYTGQGFAARVDDKTRLEFFNQAIKLLANLDTNVADYQYENALAHLMKARWTADQSIKGQALQKATELLDAICRSNAKISNFQIQRSRALVEYATFLDRSTSRMETFEDTASSLFYRVRATEVAEEAYQAYFSAKNILGDSFKERLRDSHLVSIAEVLSKVVGDSVEAHDLSIQAFRDALTESKDELTTARSKIGLATSLNRAYQKAPAWEYVEESRELLESVIETLRRRIESELKKPFGRGRFPAQRSLYLETLSLLCKATYEQYWVQGDQLAFRELELVIDEFRKRRFGKDTRNQVEASAFDLMLSEVYMDLAAVDPTRIEPALVDQGIEMQNRSLRQLTALLEAKEDLSLNARLSRVAAAMILRDYYRKAGAVEEYEWVESQLEQQKPGRPSGRGRRGMGN